jgi:hypothetical protein
LAVNLEEQNKKVAETATKTQGKIDQVHALVNSQLTDSKKSELSSVRRELILLEKLDYSADLIDAAKKRITEIEDDLIERERQTKIGEDKVESNK